MEKELENNTNDKALPEAKVQEAENAAQAAKPAGRPGSQAVQPVQPAAQAESQPAFQPAAQTGSQPVFQPAAEATNTTQCITQPSKPKKTRGKAAKVVALALCCSLAGGAIGAGTVICLNAYGIGVRPGMKITRMLNGDQGRTGRRDRNRNRNRNRNDQERSARSGGSGYSFKNRGGNNGGQRKGTGRSGQYNNVLPGNRYDFGRNRRSQGESNITGKDQGTNTPDKGSEPTTQTPPETQQTKPSTGGEAKA